MIAFAKQASLLEGDADLLVVLLATLVLLMQITAALPMTTACGQTMLMQQQGLALAGSWVWRLSGFQQLWCRRAWWQRAHQQEQQQQCRRVWQQGA
jgi:hypothetical protein